MTNSQKKPLEKTVIATDKFKGSLSAVRAASAIAEGLVKNGYCRSSREIRMFPMADGGEGSLDTMEQAYRAGGIPFRKITVASCGPLGDPVNVPVLISGDGKCAFIEMAKASGLELVAKCGKDIMKATTYGFGLVIRHLIEESGCRRLTVAIGGSATNDGGFGMLTALGFRYANRSVFRNRDVPSFLEGVTGISDASVPDVCPHLCSTEITVACDVSNPLTGPDGATMVFGPQKGGAKEDLGRIDAAVENWAKVITEWKHGGASAQNTEPSWNYPGAGAAGGTGFALHTVLGAQLKPGWKVFADLLHIEDEIKEADLVVTGEGKLDMQSLSGKLVSGIASLCRKYRRPLWVVTGKNELPPDVISETGITRIVDLTEIALRAGTSPFADPAGLITLSV